jgi:hypothetical protein
MAYEVTDATNGVVISTLVYKSLVANYFPLQITALLNARIWNVIYLVGSFLNRPAQIWLPTKTDVFQIVERLCLN